MKKPNKSKLSLAIALYFAASVNFSPADAMTTSDVGFNGNNIFKIYYYGAEDSDNEPVVNYFTEFDTARFRFTKPLVYTLKDDIKEGLNQAFKQWAEILEPGAKNKKPVQYFVVTNDVHNASARSESQTYGVNTGNPDFLRDAIQNGSNIEWLETIDSIVDSSSQNSAARGYGIIIIGQNMGKDEGDGRYGFVTPKGLLPVAQEMNGIDIIPVMFHEIGHSLGIGAKNSFEFRPSLGILYRFSDDAANANSYAAHLYDQTGRRADKSNLWIMTPKSYEQVMNNGTPEDIKEFEGNTFIVDDINALTGRNGKTYLTFRGDNVTEVLDGKTFTDPNGNQVSGIPINMWEGSPDFSHIDLERSLMSHQHYRSYNNLMEAELALLQDIGYKIDRKNFYGHSIYNNGQTLTNTQGFSARNAEGTAYVDGYNTATYGVGLHVYGSNNNITQAGNIYAAGDASVGVRVDGVNNTVTVAKDTEVHGDGKNGTGVFAAYGKNHTINIDGTVTANGEGGVGVWAEFGTNSIGATTEYRGSYMRYKREVKDGQITKMYNVGLNDIDHGSDDFSFSDLQNGDLNDKMATINVNGSIEAADSAIFIGEESFVDNINLNEGAKLKGNITNSWKDFDADSGLSDSEVVTAELDSYTNNTIYTGGLMLQYGGKLIPYKRYVPDLVTNINVNANMAYDGNIIGAENTKLNVKNGTFVYTGEANMVNATVAKNAAVFGGSYTLNDMTSKMAEGYSDDTTGKFINHGAIGAADKDNSLKIKGAGDNDGKLISDGVLVSVAGANKPEIEVEGTANIDGSVVTAINYVPDEKSTVLTATKGITGNVVDSSQSSGMMNTEVKRVDANNLVVTAVEANNLGDTTSEQNETYNAMNAMRQNLQSSGDTAGVDEMRVLYSMDATSAKSALSDIGNSAAADMAAVVQQNSAVNNIIGERLTTAYEKTNIDPTINSDIWVNFAKNWGETRSGANYHASAISGGYDKAIGKGWRLGGFVSYNSMNLGAKNAGGNIYDTRAGVYALYKRNADDAYIYADLGWLRNKNRRSISALGLSTENKYGGHIAEIGGEYKHELHNNQKIWRVSPYINLQLSHLTQGGYTENGMGVYGHKTDSLKNTYFAGQLGMEFKRVAKMGNYGARVGIKHAFSGADPDLSYNFIGDDSNRYTLRGSQDKTHFILRLFGNISSTDGWQLDCDAKFQKGSHDRDIAASITLKKLW